MIRCESPLSDYKSGDTISIPISAGEAISARINIVTSDGNNTARIGGVLTGKRRGTIVFGQQQNQIAGQILLPLEHLAYAVTSDPSGTIQVTEKSISQLVCDPYPSDKVDIPLDQAQVTIAAGAPYVPILNSRPSATAVLYMDFDGETVNDPSWNGGATIVASPASVDTTGS